MEKKTPKGKVAIITGAGTGIGKAIANRLAQEEINIVLCGRNLEKLKECEQQVQKYGIKTLILKGDLTDDDYLFTLIDKAGEHFGGVDIVINNAGMALNCKLEETSVTDFDNIMRLNVRSTYFVCQSAFVYGPSRPRWKARVASSVRVVP